MDEAAVDVVADAAILDKLRTAFAANGIDLAVNESVSGNATFTTVHGEQSLFTGDTVKLTSDYANGGQAKGIFRYLGFQDFQSDQSSVPGGSVTTGTIVKDLDGSAFYEFIGTAGEGAAITDLSVIDFANDTKWQSFITDLGIEDYSVAARWELVIADLKLTRLAEGEGWMLFDGSGASYVIQKDGANLSVTQATINVISAAASIAAGFGGKAGVAFSGAGAFAQNVILSKTNTSIRNSNIISANDVLLTSTSTQAISSAVVAASVAIGVGAKAGVGVAIGASVARNLIGYEWDFSSSPVEVRAYVEDSSINATGELKQTALANQTINSAVLAFSVGIGGAGKVGVGVAGSGVLSENWIGVDVESSINGDGATGTGIEATTITLIADDTSTISAFAGAAAVAASFAGSTAVSVAIGVSLAHNTISSSVQAFIRNADSTVKSRVGDIILGASSKDTINAVSAAAAIALAFSGKTAVGVSGAGAEATNIILTKTNAFIENSVLISAAKVDLDALNSSEINAIIAAASFSLAIGGNTGVGASIGLAIARNLIGWGPDPFAPAATYTTNEEPPQIVTGDTIEIISGPRAGDIYKYIADDTLFDPVEDSNYLHGLDYGNRDEWQRVDIERSPAKVQAYVVDTSIDATGALTLDALSEQSINAVVFAGSAAASVGGSTSVSLS
ncbi:MAG: hypothetical protein ACE1Y4_10175, partial [Lysobacterales bacterium]